MLYDLEKKVFRDEIYLLQSFYLYVEHISKFQIEDKPFEKILKYRKIILNFIRYFCPEKCNFNLNLKNIVIIPKHFVIDKNNKAQVGDCCATA